LRYKPARQALNNLLLVRKNTVFVYYLLTATSKKTLAKFFSSLKSAATEEEVKFAYAKYFNLDYDTKLRHDLYTQHVFFEFKSNKNFHNLKVRASVLAQTLYYIRRFRYNERKGNDQDRFVRMLESMSGKCLTYREPFGYDITAKNLGELGKRKAQDRVSLYLELHL